MLSPRKGCVLIPISWARADDLCARLRENGIPATACLEPLEKEAALEIPGDVALDRVHALLCENKS